MQEYEVEALIEQIFRAVARRPAYTSIIGVVQMRPCFITSTTMVNCVTAIVTVDAGAEYKGYASDITRTFPINGRYTKPQREIYDLVLKAQMSCVEMVRPGVTHDQLKQHSIEVLTKAWLSWVC
jgi:Xaa-Pro aminopeptidase